MKYVILLLFITLNTIVTATDYYVSPSGNNANFGTLGSPFKTITFGISKMIGGDILYVRTGTYVERVVIINKSGTEGSPTKIMAFPGEFPVIDGQGNLPGSEGTMVRIYSEYVHFSGFEIKNCNTSGSWAVGLGTGIYITGQHNTISHCKVHDCWGNGIFGLGDYSIIEYCEAYNCSWANAIYGGTVNWGSGISSGRDATNGTTDYSILRHNIVYHNYGEGLSTFEATHTILEDNICYNNYSVNLYVSDATDCLTQRNLVYQTEDIHPEIHQVGIQIGDETYKPASARNIFINNTVIACERNLTVGKFNDVVIANNTFVNSIYFACIQIWSGQHGNGVFSNNIIVQDDQKFTIYAGKESSHSTYFDKVLFENNLYSRIPLDDDNVTYTFLRSAGDIIGDPKLAKTGEIGSGKLTAEYFKLLITSPAINKGATISNVTNDIFLNPRDANIDIGADEFYAIDPSIKVTGITVTGAGGANTITSDNGTLQLSVEVLPSDATNKTVTWSITNGTGQAVINSSGLVTAIADGTVTARATANDGSGVFGTLLLTLSNQIIAITAITISGAGGATMITTGGTLQLSASVLPPNATNKTVTWSITNGTGQASINSAGLVTAIAPGTVTARAVSNDGSGVSGTLALTIANQIISVTSISVTGTGGVSTITVENGTLQLVATVLPNNATNKVVTWSIANGSGQASINSSGLVTGIANGTVTAKAAANDGTGIYGTMVITITIPPPNNLPVVKILSPINGKHYIEPSTINIEAEAYDTDGTISKVEYYFASTKIGESLAVPYTFSFDCTESGSFEIIAVATDDHNAVAYSAPVTLNFSPDTDISDFFNLYPNPNDGHFTIDLLTYLQDAINYVTIVDMAGKVIFEDLLSNEENTRQFDLAYLNSGTYILMIAGREILFAKKFIKR